MVIYIRDISFLANEGFETKADVLVSNGYIPGNEKYYKKMAYCPQNHFNKPKRIYGAAKNANKFLLLVDSFDIEFIVTFIAGKNISNLEIIIPDISDSFIKEYIEKIQMYLEEEEISVGLLLENPSFIRNEASFIKDHNIFISSYVYKEFIPEYDLPHPKHLLENGSINKKITRERRPSKQVIKYQVSESFSKKLIRYLNKCNRENKEIYESCGMDRKLFSKILSSADYSPKKETIFCLIIGMQLCFDDALDLLNSAGFTFSKSLLIDVIVKKYITNGDYRIDKINADLDEYGIPILGWNPR